MFVWRVLPIIVVVLIFIYNIIETSTNSVCRGIFQIWYSHPGRREGRSTYIVLGITMLSIVLYWSQLLFMITWRRFPHSRGCVEEHLGLGVARRWRVVCSCSKLFYIYFIIKNMHFVIPASPTDATFPTIVLYCLTFVGRMPTMPLRHQPGMQLQNICLRQRPRTQDKIQTRKKKRCMKFCLHLQIFQLFASIIHSCIRCFISLFCLVLGKRHTKGDQAPVMTRTTQRCLVWSYSSLVGTQFRICFRTNGRTF